VLAKPLAFRNPREESSISWLGVLALTHGLLPSDIGPAAPAPFATCFLHFFCIFCLYVLAVCAYYTPLDSLFFFTTSNPSSLSETDSLYPDSFSFDPSPIFARASVLQTPLTPYQEPRFPLRVSSQGPFTATSNCNRNFSMALASLD
jgi:hypothetical protein